MEKINGIRLHVIVCYKLVRTMVREHDDVCSLSALEWIGYGSRKPYA